MGSKVKLVVGLGNPGLKYVMTRHNVGFMAADNISRAYSLGDFGPDGQSMVIQSRIEDMKVILAKPSTDMNLSGEAVRQLLDFYKIEIEDLLVIHDDIDQPFGALRLQKNRGHGGHNGVRSIHQHLGTNAYARLKLGVGRPTHQDQDVANYVLEEFTKNEKIELATFLDRARLATIDFLKVGFEAAANIHNRKNKGA